MSIRHDLSGLTLAHFECFIKVAELGTTLKAAENMNLSQPLVSQKIAQLEQALGAKLFIRQKRRLILTGKGQVFLEHSRQMLADLERAVWTLRPQHSEKLLRIGFSNGQESAEIRMIEQLFLQRFPKVEVEAVIESRVLLSEKLLAGELDFCIVIDTENLRSNQNVCHQTLFSLPMNCIVHKSSALAQREGLTCRDLEGCGCYWPTCLRETQNLKDIQSYFREQGVHVEWKYKDVDYYTLRRYLYEENSFLLTYSRNVEDSSLKLYPLGGVSYPVIAVWRAKDTVRLAEYTAWMTAALQEMVK